MKIWLAVESLENQLADKRNSFRFLGIAASRVSRARDVKAGDVVFIYVPTPVRAFADIRIVEKDGLGRTNHVMNYDIPCSSGIFTKPLVPIERQHWLPLAIAKEHLSFGHRQASGMRNSFREILLSDARTLLRSFGLAYPDLKLDAAERVLLQSKPTPTRN